MFNECSLSRRTISFSLSNAGRGLLHHKSPTLESIIFQRIEALKQPKPEIIFKNDLDIRVDAARVSRQAETEATFLGISASIL